MPGGAAEKRLNAAQGMPDPANENTCHRRFMNAESLSLYR